MVQDCGDQRHVDMPLSSALELKSLVNAARRSPITAMNHTGSASPNSQNQHAASSSQTGTPTQPQHNHNANTGVAMPSSTLTPALAPGSASNTSPAPTNSGGLHIFLGVNRGSEYRLTQWEVHDFSDNQFFKTLKRRYIKERGFWRLCFSWYRYSGCEFWKVSSSTA